MANKICFLSIIVSLILGQSIAMAVDGNLCRLAGKTGCIKVFIKDPDNKCKEGQIIPDSLKKSLESALINRKSTKFEVVKNPEESDVQIATVIKKYQYMERGPIKPTPGIATTMLDLAASALENYVEMSVAILVTSTKTGDTLWKDDLTPYVKKRMSPDESIPVISDKVAAHFVWKCFGKPAN